MSDRLAAAQAALNSGRRDEAIDHLMAAVTEDPARPVQVYRTLSVQLYSAGRFAEGETFGAKGLERYPRDFELLNVRGVNLRKLRRYREALTVLEQATKAEPKNLSGLQNYGNVLLDLGDAVKGEAVFVRLARAHPRNAEDPRQLGRALAQQGKLEPALVRFRQSVTLKPDSVDSWMDIASLLAGANRDTEAQAQLDKAIAANPDDARLLEGKTVMFRRLGQKSLAIAFVREFLTAHPEAAWAYHQLGIMVAEQDRAEGNVLLGQAVALGPGQLDYVIQLIDNLERTRSGDEGGHIEEAYQLAKTILHRSAEFTESATMVIFGIMTRVCDFDGLEKVGDFRTLGRSWAGSGRHTALLKQLAQVKNDTDRLELVEQHRIWARGVETMSSHRPIKRLPARPPGGKIRLGFMSSDLRQHPVGYFALPLFDHFDRERFEVFVYSFYTGQEDAAQRHITERVSAYRWWPDISAVGAAEKIAEDQLDMLIELGGSTHMNKLEVMAYKPAPLQASWLGYPHSAGLAAIDYLLVDPYLQPENIALLIEKPLPMRNAWYALGERAFREDPKVEIQSPAVRNGFVTFGTANQPYKYTREVLAAWAEILRQTPGSKFMFVRPEGSSESFRLNLIGHFARGSVSADRIIFNTVRGRHLPFYNEMDISLDPFPQTGGTTTCESLWMGVPVITRVGPAVFERLSYSVLMNLGLEAFCARDTEAYIAAAVELARNVPQISDLRATLRDRMKASPLGKTEQFAQDFYATIESVVRPSGR